jgi:diamine N-acetyltransferase
LIDLSISHWHAWRVPSQKNEFELIELNERAREFLLLGVNENQKNLVATVAQSFADALFPPADYENGAPLPWIRGVLHNSKPAAFIMCADPTEQQKDPWLWRLLVDKSHQGCGIGKFAVESVLARYKEMGCTRVLVCWAPVEGNAGDFYKKLGFVETGEKMGEEIIAEFKR